jgi:hypothetical protein
MVSESAAECRAWAECLQQASVEKGRRDMQELRIQHNAALLQVESLKRQLQLYDQSGAGVPRRSREGGASRASAPHEPIRLTDDDRLDGSSELFQKGLVKSRKSTFENGPETSVRADVDESFAHKTMQLDCGTGNENRSPNSVNSSSEDRFSAPTRDSTNGTPRAPLLPTGANRTNRGALTDRASKKDRTGTSRSVCAGQKFPPDMAGSLQMALTLKPHMLALISRCSPSRRRLEGLVVNGVGHSAEDALGGNTTSQISVVLYEKAWRWEIDPTYNERSVQCDATPASLTERSESVLSDAWVWLERGRTEYADFKVSDFVGS